MKALARRALRPPSQAALRVLRDLSVQLSILSGLLQVISTKNHS